MLKGAFVVGENQDANSDWSRRFKANLMESMVEIRGMLGTAKITGRDLLQMKKGDIIQLNEDYEHPVEILVEDVRKFWGMIGTHNSGRALQITGVEHVKRSN